MLVAASGDLDRLETFLEAGLTVDMRAEDQSTVLHCAARASQATVVTYLLAKGANVDLKNDKHRLPIHEAIISNSPQTLECFLHRMTQEELQASGKELEHYLARWGNLNIVNAYLTRLGSDFTDRYASKKLDFAVRTGNDSLVATLLDDPTINGNNRAPRAGYTPIHLAAYYGKRKIMEILIACGRIDKTLKTHDSRQALHIAASKGHTAIVEQLIQHSSVDINCRDSYKATPLHHATSNGHWETVSLLLKHSESNEDGRCISSDASPTGLSFVTEDLLHRLFKHPDFEGPNKILPGTCQTMLHVAAKRGDCEVIEVLLAYPDIDVNKCVGYFGSPLMCAARNGKLEAARLLLQHKDIDVDQRSRWSNRTALQWAKIRNHNEIANLLLSHGTIDYTVKAPTTVPTTAHIDNSQNTTLQPYHETHFDQLDNDVDGAPTEAWEEFLDMDEGMEE